MSSAIGESSGMQHGAPGSGEHVHGGLSTTLTSGVSTTPSNTRFSMAEHFAALILTHASTTNPSAQFAPSKSTGAAGAGPAAAFPLAANSSAKCVQAPTHSPPLPISSGAFLNNDTTVTSEHGAPAPMQLEMQEAKPSADGASKDTSTSATKDKEQALKQMQERLLLLRHASRCTAEGDSCTFTSYCGSVKALWTHLCQCTDSQCQTAHCVSTRYVLNHYLRCMDVKCAICSPVRSGMGKPPGRSLCE